MWLGHHSPAFTLATYVHLLTDDLPDPSFLDALTGGHSEIEGVREAGEGPQRDQAPYRKGKSSK